MNAVFIIGLVMAPATTMEQTYAATKTVTKYYEGASYLETTVNCKAGILKYTKIVTAAPAGFGITAYYAGVVPYVSSGEGVVLRNDGRINTFDAAAKKVCFG